MDSQNIDTNPIPAGSPEQQAQAERLARYWNVIFWVTAVCLAMTLIGDAILKPFRPEHFIYLAQNFVAGRLSIDDMTHISSDYQEWQGHIYLPMGPLPAVVLIPFLPLFKLGFEPSWISVFVTALNVWVFYSIYDRLGITGDKRRWALLLFFGGTVYFGLAATMNAWYFAQVLGTACLLLAILVAVGQRKPFITGLLVGLAAGARMTYLFSLPFFIALLWQESTDPGWRSRLIHTGRRSIILGLGLAIPVLLLLGYNYARFGNPLDTGYGTDIVSTPFLEQSRSYGLFSVTHIPTNLYYLLLQGPIPYPSTDSPVYIFPFLQPSPMGMGIVFTSPALLYIFRAGLRSPIVKASWLGVGAMLIPLLTYYATGWLTFGNRYTLDLMPFLVLIAVYGFPEPLKHRVRGLIILSVMINLWGNYWIHSWLTPRP